MSEVSLPTRLPSSDPIRAEGHFHAPLAAALIVSVLLTGFLVGFFSPGMTMIGSAIGTAVVILLDLTVSLAFFHAPFPVFAVFIGLSGGAVLGATGGWLGEWAQARAARERRA